MHYLICLYIYKSDFIVIGVQKANQHLHAIYGIYKCQLINYGFKNVPYISNRLHG